MVDHPPIEPKKMCKVLSCERKTANPPSIFLSTNPTELAPVGTGGAWGGMSHGMKRLGFHMLTGGAVLAILAWIGARNYLLFHSLAELFSVVIIASLCMLVWNSTRHLDNRYLLFLGAALPCVGLLDLVHLLAYKGMGVFGQGEANTATQLWIAQRWGGERGVCGGAVVHRAPDPCAGRFSPVSAWRGRCCWRRSFSGVYFRSASLRGRG